MVAEISYGKRMIFLDEVTNKEGRLRWIDLPRFKDP